MLGTASLLCKEITEYSDINILHNVLSCLIDFIVDANCRANDTLSHLIKRIIYDATLEAPIIKSLWKRHYGIAGRLDCWTVGLLDLSVNSVKSVKPSQTFYVWMISSLFHGIGLLVNVGKSVKPLQTFYI